MIHAKKQNLLLAALAALLAVLILSIIILASVPPVSRDALTHHLAVPKLWIKQGAIYEIPDLPVSYYPMNLDLLYTIPLYFGNDIIPKYIHFAFALATAWLIFKYLYDKLNRVYALVGALFFLTTPIIVKLSITAYVDLGLIFFTTASLLYLLKWAEKDFNFRFLAVSAVSCGFALGTKFNGLISLFLLSILTPYLYLKCNQTHSKKETVRHQAKAFAYGALFVSIACMVYLPWMVKNYVWTGNPLYPLFNTHTQAPQPAKDTLQTYAKKPSRYSEDYQNHPDKKSQEIGSHFVVRKLVYGESWWETASIPIRIFFQGQDDSPKFFDGKLNPLLLILPLFVMVGPFKYPGRFNWEIRLFVIFSILYLLFVFFRIDMRIRWISPIIPPLVILSVIGLSRIKQFCDTCAKPGQAKLCTLSLWLIVTVMFILNAVYIANLFKSVDPISYLSGRMTRDAYIQRFLPEYSVIAFANQNTPQDSVILCLFLGNRQYYSDRKMNFDYNFFKNVIKESESPQMAADLLTEGSISHLMVRQDLFNKWSHDNFTPSEKETVSLLFSRYTGTLLSKDGYTLFKLNGPGDGERYDGFGNNSSL